MAELDEEDSRGNEGAAEVEAREFEVITMAACSTCMF